MKPCIYLREQTANKVTSWILLLAASLFLVATVIFLVCSMLPQVFVICFMLALLLLWVAIPGWIMNTRTYRLTREGIEVGGLLRRKRGYSWNKVQHIGIYGYGATASMRGFLSGICIFLEPVPDDFAYDTMKSYYSLARRWRAVIVIDYSRMALDDIAAVYPGEIRDHRLTQQKLHDPEAFEKLRKELN